jgi:hypothetical protein
MSRKKVNLRTLPTWLQYLIALTVTAIVVVIAWLVSRGTPTPATTWVEHTLAPILGWLFIILVVFLIILRLTKRRK